jgi:hypothetical protein
MEPLGNLSESVSLVTHSDLQVRVRAFDCVRETNAGPALDY